MRHAVTALLWCGAALVCDGFAVRRTLTMKRSASRAQKGSVDEGWEKPYAQLKLKTRPLLMTFSNRTLRTMQLVYTFVEKGGVWWQGCGAAYKKPNEESSPLTQYGGRKRADALCVKS